MNNTYSSDMAQVVETESALADYNNTVAKHDATLEQLQKREKEHSQQFRAHFPNLEHDAVACLQKLFRQKPPQGRDQAPKKSPPQPLPALCRRSGV